MGLIPSGWLTARSIEQLAALVEQADALMFGDPAIWQEFLHRIRFDQPNNEPPTQGLSLASLELSSFNTVALKLAARFPWATPRLGRRNRLVGAHARRLVESSSGLCLLVAPTDTPETDISVGRAFQHVWLELTQQQFAVQPMTSLSAIIYDAVLRSGETASSLGQKNLETILNQLQTVVPEVAGRRPAELLRFGYSEPPSGRARRLPLETVLRESPLP